MYSQFKIQLYLEITLPILKKSHAFLTSKRNYTEKEEKKKKTEVEKITEPLGDAQNSETYETSQTY